MLIAVICVKSSHRRCPAMVKDIGSAESGDGRLPLKWRDGETDRLTPDHVPARAFHVLEKEKDSQTNATYGQCFFRLSDRLDLSALLANRLQQLLSSDGLTEYSMKWVMKATPA